MWPVTATIIMNTKTIFQWCWQQGKTGMQNLSELPQLHKSVTPHELNTFAEKKNQVSLFITFYNNTYSI